MGGATMFYTFRQNNTFGTWKGDYKTIIVEASSAKEADFIAEQNGVYFDGCRDGIDCPCCGDRWSRTYDDSEGTPEPTIYGEPVSTDDSTCKVVRKPDAD